ncbi:5'/3'-nucleotidase SurE [gamma proteobacterium HTCC5015]|nr:5'/3'-nucleotidase SurE [gamma proteobacterium HTCC5015]
MRILVSNDDGYRAPGIEVLAQSLAALGSVTVVAPDHNRSATSNALTLYNPLRVHREEQDVYAVNGTPADCVHLAITGLLDETPDMVVSGINNGANMGEDVIYSGTVGAAMEGRYLGSPSLAVSIAAFDPQHYATAARVASEVVQRLVDKPLPADLLLNVNVPDMAYEALKGWRVTRCGYRHQSEPVIHDRDPRGRDMYWIGSPGAQADAGEGTDFWAVEQGYVSITPLRIEMTDRERLSTIEEWLA